MGQGGQAAGLLNLKTTVDALPHYMDAKNVKLFTGHKIYTKAEMEARYETVLEEYAKVLNIEGLTLSEMVRRDVIPAVSGYVGEVSKAVKNEKLAVKGLKCKAQTALISKLCAGLDAAYDQVAALDDLLEKAKAQKDALAQAKFFKAKVIPAMEALRATVDGMELDVSAKAWPYPSYGDLMFRV